MSLQNYYENLMDNYEKCAYPNNYNICLSSLLNACKIISANASNPKLNTFKQTIRNFIDLLFTINRKDNNFISRIIVDLYKTCDNKEILEYIMQKIYENMLTHKLKYHCAIYRTSADKQPFVVIFIDGHGTDLTTRITADSNILSYNFSPGAGIITLHSDDWMPEYIIQSLESSLSSQPSTFAEVIGGIGCVKTHYVKELDELDTDNEHIVSDWTMMLAHKYRKQSCKLIKPIKNKLYNFDKLVSPGIYVLALVNTDADESNTQLLNLLIHDDMVALNRLFKVDDNHCENIFHNNIVETLGVSEVITSDKDIELNDICQYFQGLGIVNIGLIDYACRYTKNVCETSTNKQMVIEELGSHPKFHKFGGKFHKFGGKQRKSRKTYNKRIRNRRVSRYTVGIR